MNRLLSTLLLGTIAAGLSACVTAYDQRADLKAELQQQVRGCYVLPQEARGSDPVVVEARLKLDGSLERTPEVVAGPPNSANAKAAVIALKKCAPFQIPEKWASRYDAWKVMRIEFDPR